MMFQFQDMLQDYESDIAILTSLPGTNGGYDDETGEPIKGTPATTSRTEARAVVLPYSANQIYQSGGRLTQTHRQLITDLVLPTKAIIEHAGLKYSVENKTGYEEHADFSVYELKWVSAFG
ncbi:hypothetical protein NCCP2716_27770 [Sporosarcina sp. NCCP-2716]|uniref:hypothetical protein n=1 Tax=Sporosarcina sp. NCCP-2716 TaxID=2943679 RepID=UPI0020425355|nr:hypothetical protein [Sporosarcina sp. NCCP-2716]GKV70279.1 hypothetical protein NCCP2716_27770 [Sporosarcina sp. NCCP-2716]